MSESIRHLPGITSSCISTHRLRTHVLASGDAGGQPVLFLHGNLASSTFWEETMLALPASFHAAAPDQRGYGLTDPEPLDATGGVGAWVDDAVALADALGWERFHVVGHSLGGCVVWGLVARYAERIISATLVAPGPPCGFGGAHGERGETNFADGAGSGAGLVLPALVEAIANRRRGDATDVFSPRSLMNRLYWKPPFRPAREENLLTAMLQVHLGDDHFPGDVRTSTNWPGFAPGRFGPINALAPLYNDWVLPGLLDAAAKPPLLWVYGADDAVVRNDSLSDVGTLGKLGMRADWPGDDVFPPQPLLTQVTFALDQYAAHGGAVTRLVLPDTGHTPYLERPIEFQQALDRHLGQGE
ncbi:MAG: alpha/beta hydrolase [Pirellulales bacterium]